MAFAADKTRQATAGTGEVVEKSLRFNDGTSPYLTRTPGSSGDSTQKFTFSAWLKKCTTGNFQNIFEAGDATTDLCSIFFRNGDIIQVSSATSNSTTFKLQTHEIFRDPNAWYHIVLACDTTQGTDTNRTKLYINGEQITSFAYASYPAQNISIHVNSDVVHTIGRSVSTYNHFDGYMAEVYHIDGLQLAASSFGESNAYGGWDPVKYSGSVGTNGSYLSFSNASALGTDAKGSNNWTTNNIDASDQTLDTPTNSFATFNSIAWRSDSSIVKPTYYESNLKATMHISSEAYSSFHALSGKWYFEILYSTYVYGLYLCVNVPSDADRSLWPPAVCYSDTGNKRFNDSWSSYGATYTEGDIIGVALDMDGDNVTFYKNGSSQGVLNGGLNAGKAYGVFLTGERDGVVTANFGQDSSFAGQKTAQGNQDSNDIGDFYYEPPSTYLAMCTSNMPTPAVTPSAHFNALLYSGNNTIQRQLTGVGFQPDLVWIRPRSGTYGANGHKIFDAVRGVGKQIYPHATNVEATNMNNLYAFDSDGFSLGQVSVDGVTNGASTEFVAWNWKANGSGSANTTGSINSTVSANTAAGFSIVSYTGTGSAGNVGHGLSQAPEMMIAKNRDSTTSWPVGHMYAATSSPEDYYSKLEQTDDFTDHASIEMWGNTAPSATLLYIGDHAWINGSGDDYIAYLFHSVDGYSKVGTYTGNGYADGTFVYTGFRPKFIFIKRSNSSGQGSPIFDTARDEYNVATKCIYSNSANVETTTDGIIDILSNGFKARNTDGSVNTNGGTYVYYAVAETPFKYSNAR